MTVKNAKEIAQEWVEKRAADFPDFFGAFYVGSINHMKDEDPFPSTSDVDLRIVLDRELPPSLMTVTGDLRQKKIPYKGVILEPLYRSKNAFLEGESFVGKPWAYAFTVPNVILDPTGQLARIQLEVSKHFAEKKWILKRCENAKDNALQWLESNMSLPKLPGWCNFFILKIAGFFHFGLSILAQIPCIADLKGITARKAFVASRKTLEQYKEHQLFYSLLEILGSDRMSEGQVRGYLQELKEAYDCAIKVFPRISA